MYTSLVHKAWNSASNGLFRVFCFDLIFCYWFFFQKKLLFCYSFVRFQTPCSCEFDFAAIKRGFCLLYFLCSLVKDDKFFFFIFFFFPAFRKLRGLVPLKQGQRSQNCSSKSVFAHSLHRKISTSDSYAFGAVSEKVISPPVLCYLSVCKMRLGNNICSLLHFPGRTA